jgi:hypothetical protein
MSHNFLAARSFSYLFENRASTGYKEEIIVRTDVTVVFT